MLHGVRHVHAAGAVNGAQRCSAGCCQLPAVQQAEQPGAAADAHARSLRRMSDDSRGGGAAAEEAGEAEAKEAAVCERVHAIGPPGHPDALQLVTLEARAVRRAACAVGRQRRAVQRR